VRNRVIIFFQTAKEKEVKMLKKTLSSIFVLLISFVLVLPASANPGKPDFCPHIWADGESWGTKVTTVLPEPKGNNMHSFDNLYVVTNSNNPLGQMPIGEAAPGNTDYNGGRWATQTVMWTSEGFAYHGIVPVLMSDDDIYHHESLGHLIVIDGPPAGGPPAYFSCPLLPVKCDN
jgi:hypothetical protein